MAVASATDNARIAAVFEEIADLLEVQGDLPVIFVLQLALPVVE